MSYADNEKLGQCVFIQSDQDLTVLSTSFRKSFLLGALNRSKFVNFCHDLMQNHLS